MKSLILLALAGITTSAIVFGIPEITFAQTTTAPEYKLLEPLPFITKEGSTNKTDVTTYIPGAVQLMIGVAGVLAVIMIMFGGIKFMSTDAFQGKNDARAIIWNAVWGLILTIGAYVILNTINPTLVTLNLNIDKLPIRGEIPGTGVGGSTGGGATPISARDAGCSDCVPLPANVPAKAPGQGCAQPGPCSVDRNVAQKLSNLATRLEQENIQWLVSESFPPTRGHLAECQQLNKPLSGTCVDVSLQSERSAANIKKFIDESSAVGLRAVYEVASKARFDYLAKNGITNVILPLKKDCAPANDLDTSCSHITGEHFSVYNK